jgi:hypothetical protein
MTCYVVLGVFMSANLALIAGVMLSDRGMRDLRALNRVGDRRSKSRA